MVNVKHTPDNQSKAGEKTEAEIKSVDGQAGQRKKSSQDAMSHLKAGTHEAAGGGKKRGHDH